MKSTTTTPTWQTLQTIIISIRHCNVKPSRRGCLYYYIFVTLLLYIISLFSSCQHIQPQTTRKKQLKHSSQVPYWRIGKKVSTQREKPPQPKTQNSAADHEGARVHAAVQRGQEPKRPQTGVNRRYTSNSRKRCVRHHQRAKTST